MKDKILVLIIGIFIGAIITTTAFLIYNNTKSNNSNQLEMMKPNGNGQMREKDKTKRRYKKSTIHNTRRN